MNDTAHEERYENYFFISIWRSSHSHWALERDENASKRKIKMISNLNKQKTKKNFSDLATNEKEKQERPTAETMWSESNEEKRTEITTSETSIE